MSPPTQLASSGTNCIWGAISGSACSFSNISGRWSSVMKMIGCSNMPSGFKISLTYSGSISNAALGSQPENCATRANNRSPGGPSNERECITEYIAESLLSPNMASNTEHISRTGRLRMLIPTPLLYDLNRVRML